MTCATPRDQRIDELEARVEALTLLVALLMLPRPQALRFFDSVSR